MHFKLSNHIHKRTNQINQLPTMNFSIHPRSFIHQTIKGIKCRRLTIFLRILCKYKYLLSHKVRVL